MTLITKVRCLVPLRLRRILRCGPCLAVTELNLGALVVVLLGRVVLPVMSEQDVQNGETSADQTDTTLGISKDKSEGAISDWKGEVGHIPRHNDTHEDDSLVGRCTILKHQHESIETEANSETTGSEQTHNT